MTGPPAATRTTPRGDIACLSTLPGWRLHVPGHADEAEALLRDAATRDEPTYLRLSEATNTHSRTRPVPTACTWSDTIAPTL